MDEVLEARQKYRDGLITLGEYLSVVDSYLDEPEAPAPAPAPVATKAAKESK
jgi:hypothetical protein